jgi:hypothetical protein
MQPVQPAVPPSSRIPSIFDLPLSEEDSKLFQDCPHPQTPPTIQFVDLERKCKVYISSKHFKKLRSDPVTLPKNTHLETKRSNKGKT